MQTLPLTKIGLILFIVFCVLAAATTPAWLIGAVAGLALMALD